jgi:hypothetical protein
MPSSLPKELLLYMKLVSFPLSGRYKRRKNRCAIRKTKNVIVPLVIAKIRKSVVGKNDTPD